MDFDAFTTLWERHPAWRLLRAHHSPLILTFLGTFFVEGNRGASSAGELATALDDLLYDLNTSLPTDDGSVRFVCSWATDPAAVDEVVEAIAGLG